MSRKKLGILVLAVMVFGALAPALLAPDVAEAGKSGLGQWMIYAENHPNGCVPLPYDCYVLFIYPSNP